MIRINLNPNKNKKISGKTDLLKRFPFSINSIKEFNFGFLLVLIPGVFLILLVILFLYTNNRLSELRDEKAKLEEEVKKQRALKARFEEIKKLIAEESKREEELTKKIKIYQYIGSSTESVKDSVEITEKIINENLSFILSKFDSNGAILIGVSKNLNTLNQIQSLNIPNFDIRISVVDSYLYSGSMYTEVTRFSPRYYIFGLELSKKTGEELKK